MVDMRLGILESFGIEIEYMIVNRETLNVMPVSDEVIKSASGRYSNDYENWKIGWSNEFVLHIMELKNAGPVPSLRGLPGAFLYEIKRINAILRPLGGLLMPSAMHPWMDPLRETRLWPHRYRKVYETYDRIFNCRSHGWANLQSIHLNISFNGDGEFGRLHAAARLVLPIIPALAAASPIADGKITGLLDTRLHHYMSNQKKVPSVMGRIIPEPVYTEAEYRNVILARMYGDIAEYDHEGTLRHEWLNSRGAIPRFERGALEIRVIDSQECPAANIAVADMITSVIRQLVSEDRAAAGKQRRWKVAPLASIFRETVKYGEHAVIGDTGYLGMFGFPGKKAKAGELWKYLLEESESKKLLAAASLRTIISILENGTLSSRILRLAGKDPSRERLKEIYSELCRCLARNALFTV